MSSRSSPGGRYIDEMRYAEMIHATALLVMERDRQRLKKAEELMHPEIYNLYVGSKAIGYIGAKMPVTPAQYRHFMKKFRVLMAKRAFLAPEVWEKRRDKFLIDADDLITRSVREPERPELLPQTPYDGHEAPADRVSAFGRGWRAVKRVITGETAHDSSSSAD